LAPSNANIIQQRIDSSSLPFFDSKGLIYTDFMSRATLVNPTYILESLGKFLTIFENRRPLTAAGE